MGPTQTVFGFIIVAMLVGLGLYYAWRQRQTLYWLRQSNLPVEDVQFFRNQAWRRLAGSVLMLLLAGLFVGGLLLEGPAQLIIDANEAARARNEAPVNDPANKDFARFYGGYWGALLLVLLAIIGLAGYEFFAIRRYSVRHLRRLQDERRAMIAEETARLRTQRNGHVR